MASTAIPPETHDLIVTGTKAQELLNNETFTATVNELSAQITNAILNTNIPEREKRDDLYMLHKALENIIVILKASADIKIIANESLKDIDESDSDLEPINEDQ